MKYLGIDYGARQVGVAVSNAEGTIAFPRGNVPNDDKLMPALAAMCRDEKIETILVGDTRAFSGADNLITPEADAFMERLARETGVPVSRAREAWSTVEAARYAPKGREHDDSAAAAVILQRFLDMKGKGA